MNQFSLLECEFVTTVCNLRQTIYKYCCQFQQKIILNMCAIFVQKKKKMLDLNNGCLHFFLKKKPEYRHKRLHIISTCIYKLGVMVDRLSMGIRNNRVVNMKTISNQYFHSILPFHHFWMEKIYRVMIEKINNFVGLLLQFFAFLLLLIQLLWKKDQKWNLCNRNRKIALFWFKITASLSGHCKNI